MKTDIRKYQAKPTGVQLAVTMLLACFGIGLLNTFFIANHPNLPGAHDVQLAVFGFEATIIAAIARGRNWARILYLILGLGGVFSTLVMAHMLIRLNGPLSFYVELTEGILQTVAMILLFQRDASAWFRGDQRAVATPQYPMRQPYRPYNR